MEPSESSQKSLGVPISELWRNSDVNGSQDRNINKIKSRPHKKH